MILVKDDLSLVRTDTKDGYAGWIDRIVDDVCGYTDGFKYVVKPRKHTTWLKGHGNIKFTETKRKYPFARITLSRYHIKLPPELRRIGDNDERTNKSFPTRRAAIECAQSLKTG